MRIIHTSDWHLGQNFMGKSRAPEHQAFLAWLLVKIENHHVDALIVAGDIFDTGSPPSYAREMYNRFIVDMQNSQCELVVLGGNHDSVATLNESKDLLACLNTRVVSGVSDNNEEQVFVLKNRAGEVGAILCAIPFIRPRDVLQSQAGQSGKDKQQAMQQAISEHYQTLYTQAVTLRDTLSQVVPIIATGHLTTVGASTSDSVREIYIGTLDAFPASAFPPADYIALGHIHQSQLVAKSEHIRYSGSPIALSFDETGKKKAKSVLLVEFNKGKFTQASPLEVPCFQAMQVIKGDLECIEKQLSTLPESHDLKENEMIWLEIIVTSQDYLNDLQTRLQTMTADLPVEILLLRRERKNRQVVMPNEEKETLNELSVGDVFERRLNEETWESEDDKQRAERLMLVFKQVVIELAEEEHS
ncbi:MAG TPA: exonuclease subunit SbcD [Leucothrix mucor]|nr:exonuclease subunit SbcD [Leucothrix mucor]